jgi:predicted DNA-binding transcriptional regulator YafY
MAIVVEINRSITSSTTASSTTHRVVSPIRFLGRDRFLGLCLSREEPRQFYLDRCQNVRLAMAANFLMPVAG